MNFKKTAGCVVVAAILAVSYAEAQVPADNVSARRHPNIAAAQRLVTQAYERIDAAQGANEFDMNGHAARAKELLTEANIELKAAAETSNIR